MHSLYSAFYSSSLLSSLQLLLNFRISVSIVLSHLVLNCFRSRYVSFSPLHCCVYHQFLGRTFAIIFCFRLGYLLPSSLSLIAVCLALSFCNCFVINSSPLIGAFKLAGIACSVLTTNPPEISHYPSLSARGIYSSRFECTTLAPLFSAAYRLNSILKGQKLSVFA